MVHPVGRILPSRGDDHPRDCSSAVHSALKEIWHRTGLLLEMGIELSSGRFPSLATAARVSSFKVKVLAVIFSCATIKLQSLKTSGETAMLTNTFCCDTMAFNLIRFHTAMRLLLNNDFALNFDDQHFSYTFSEVFSPTSTLTTHSGAQDYKNLSIRFTPIRM